MKLKNKITRSRASRPTFFIWLIIGLALLLLALLMSVFSYENITLNIAKITRKTDRLNVLRNQYLKPQLLLILRIVLWLTLIGWLGLFRWLAQLEEKLQRLVLLSIQLVLVPCQNLSKLSLSQKIILIVSIVLVAISRLFYSSLFPLQYDEAFAYIHLIDKGWLVSATYYPGPNNHILFSEIASILNLWLPSLMALRLPPILGSVLLWFLLWDSFRNYIRFEWSLLLATLIVFTPTLSVYSVMGRSYSLQLVCGLVGLRTILAKEYQVLHRLAFVVSSIAGFYLIPTYLYLFSTLVVYKTGQLFWQKSHRTLRIWSLDILIIVLVISILYTPVITFNGLSAIVNNSWVQSLTFTQWFSQFPNWAAELSQALGGDTTGFGIMLIYIITVIAYTIMRPRQYFWLLSLLLPLLMVLGQRVLPPARTWQYLWLIAGFFIVHLPVHISNTHKFKYLTTLILAAFLLFYAFTTTQQFRQIAQTPHPHIEITQKIIHQPKPQRILVTQDTYVVFMQYYNLQNGNKHQVDLKMVDGVKYDWVIQSASANKLPKSFQVYFKNKEVVIGKRQ